jgi:hypothetical protein
VTDMVSTPHTCEHTTRQTTEGQVNSTDTCMQCCPGTDLPSVGHLTRHLSLRNWDAGDCSKVPVVLDGDRSGSGVVLSDRYR